MINSLNFNAFFTERSVPVGQFNACFVGVDASSMGEAVSGAGNCNSANKQENMLKAQQEMVFCVWWWRGGGEEVVGIYKCMLKYTYRLSDSVDTGMA